jgi:hypothetical protein
MTKTIGTFMEKDGVLPSSDEEQDSWKWCTGNNDTECTIEGEKTMNVGDQMVVAIYNPASVDYHQVTIPVSFDKFTASTRINSVLTR